MKRFTILFCLIFCILNTAWAQNYDPLWLRYQALPQTQIKDTKPFFENIQFASVTGRLEASIKTELELGLKGLLGLQPTFSTLGKSPLINNGLLVGTTKSQQIAKLAGNIDYLGQEGFLIKTIKNKGQQRLLLAANSETGILYGTFKLLQHLQWKTDLSDINSYEKPMLSIRHVNNWDDPAGHVERGYAGKSLFDWSNIGVIKPRYVHYARLLASMSINGSVINNVNTFTADSKGWILLKSEELDKIAGYAELLWSYGIKTFISANFTAPELIGGLETSDPLDPQVIAWWEAKVQECAQKLPGFGGLLVKADSEGEKGPIYYGRDHADGANMLAEAVAPYNGIIIWRAFVYGVEGLSEDRVMHAYENFHPLDGKFKDNVILQSKNGPWDFQVREPVAPLFGAMPQTNMNIELQGTQEYTGQATHTVYLVPQWKEALNFDTYATGKGSTVEEIIKGNLFDYKHSGISGVLNFGTEDNWTGNYLAQANTYSLGRLAWNPTLSSEDILKEWIQLSFGHDPQVNHTLQEIMLNSWKVYEDYTSPLGVGFMTDYAHYDPAPMLREFMHHADDKAIGVDRSRQGTGYAAQYQQPWKDIFSNINTCPEDLLLFFHRVPYTHELQSGKTLIQHIYDAHFEGAQQVAQFVTKWKKLKGKIDDDRYQHILKKFQEQLAHAEIWRDTINGYFFYKSQIDDQEKRLTKPVKNLFPLKKQ